MLTYFAGQTHLHKQEVAELAKQQLHAGRVPEPVDLGNVHVMQLKRMEVEEIY
jgi:hypothetical protein